MAQKGGYRNLIKTKFPDAVCYPVSGIDPESRRYAAQPGAASEIVEYGNSPAQTWKRLYERLIKEGLI